MSGDLIFAAGVFVASVASIVGLGLFIISVVLEAQHRHRKRIARVSRKRLSGRLDLEEARLALAKNKQDSGAMVGLTDALARFVPLLDTKRLRANMHRANLDLSIGAFVLIAVVVAVVIGLLASMITGWPLAVLILPALFSGMYVTDWFVRMRGDMIANRFLKQLPEGLDTVIRGIKSGLPVIECIGTVGDEYPDPIGGYFRAISEHVQLGEPIDKALWRTARVVNRPEMDFLAIAISIQIETGGSLADALGNLAKLLRDRERMKLKIKAISSEAKASAMIIGALPILMLALLSYMSPEYVWPLFTDPRGQMMLMGGGTSMAIGGFVMWRMTQFEI